MPDAWTVQQRVEPGTRYAGMETQADLEEITATLPAELLEELESIG